MWNEVGGKSEVSDKNCTRSGNFSNDQD